jgi:hypothetical protein
MAETGLEYLEYDPRIRRTKAITVGVFPPDERERSYRAYTRWYNPQWEGCCEHTVDAVNGSEAKRAAIQEHKDRCIPDPPETTP